MSCTDDKKYYRKMLKEVQEKLANLPKNSLICQALDESKINKISEQIDNKESKNLEWNYWLPLFLFIKRHPISEIQAFENDINLVDKYSKSTS